MARVSIYVPDDLKTRMDAAGDAINWSEVARPAFHAALANHEHIKGRTMDTVIERLRASKAEHTTDVENSAKEDGRYWAENTASFSDLKRVSKIDLSDYYTDDEAIFRALHLAVDPRERLDMKEALEPLFGDDDDVAAEHAYHFIEGAQEVFGEVENKL